MHHHRYFLGGGFPETELQNRIVILGERITKQADQSIAGTNILTTLHVIQLIISIFRKGNITVIQ